MRVEAISTEAARLNAIRRAQLMTALRRANQSTNNTSVVEEMDRPTDLFLSGTNLPTVQSNDISTNLQNGLYA
jgi:hypothetical protein